MRYFGNVVLLSMLGEMNAFVQLPSMNCLTQSALPISKILAISQTAFRRSLSRVSFDEGFQETPNALLYGKNASSGLERNSYVLATTNDSINNSRSLYVIISRRGSIAEGLAAIEKTSISGGHLNLKDFTSLMNHCAYQIQKGRACLDDAFSIISLSKSCGFTADTILFNCLLACCARAAAHGKVTLKDGSAILQAMNSANVTPDITTFNTLLDICAKSAGNDEHEAPITPMTGFSLLKLIEDNGLTPNVFTFTSLMQMLDQHGVPGNVRLFNAMMNLVAKAAARGLAGPADGQAVLRTMQRRGVPPSVVSFNSFIEVCANDAGKGRGSSLSDGLGALEAMRREGLVPDLVTLNSLLRLVARVAGAGGATVEDAYRVLARLKKDGVHPNRVSLTLLLQTMSKACKLGSDCLNDARRVYKAMRALGSGQLDTPMYNAFLQAMQALGSEDAVAAADEVFEEIPLKMRDSYTYSAMLGLLGRAGLPHRALQVLSVARSHGFKPNTYMYNAAMGACASAQLFDKVLILHGEMQQDRVTGDAMTRSFLLEAHQGKIR